MYKGNQARKEVKQKKEEKLRKEKNDAALKI